MSVCPQLWLDGRFVERADAKVSVFDRGYLFSHAAYEVSAVVNGCLVDGLAHVERLKRTLAGLEIPMPMEAEAILRLHEELISRNGVTEGLIYLQVTGGAYEMRDFYGPESFTPSMLMFATDVNLIGEKQEHGISAISVEDLRWARRDYKTTQLLHQTQAYRRARAEGAVTAFLHEEGVVTEAASANAFIVTQDGILVTRPLGHEILPGITRMALLKLIETTGVAFEERAFTLDEVMFAREAFTSSTGAMVAPVVRFDGEPLGDGMPGPVTRQMQRIYFEHAGFDVAARAPWCLD